MKKLSYLPIVLSALLLFPIATWSSVSQEESMLQHRLVTALVHYFQGPDIDLRVPPLATGKNFSLFIRKCPDSEERSEYYTDMTELLEELSNFPYVRYPEYDSPDLRFDVLELSGLLPLFLAVESHTRHLKAMSDSEWRSSNDGSSPVPYRAACGTLMKLAKIEADEK